MVRSLLSGCVLAAVAGVAVLIGSGSDLEHVALLGAALGGVLGLVAARSPFGKIGGFVGGFLFAWIGFAVRAAVLPDTTAGRAVAAFVVVLVCAVAAAVSNGWVPMWSTLLGAAALVGAYETAYTNSPSELLTQSPKAAMTMLFAVALGLLGTTVAATVFGPRSAEDPGNAGPPQVDPDQTDDPEETDVSDVSDDFELVMAGEK